MPQVDTQERYYTGNSLNIWFAVSSILFFISIVLTFVDDNDDDFKDYQREFRSIVAANTEEQVKLAIEGISEQKEEYEQKLVEAQENFDAKSEDLKLAELHLEKWKGKFYQANMDFLHHKGEIDALKYQLEDTRAHDSHGHDNEDLHENPIEDIFAKAIEKLEVLRLEKEKNEAMVANAEAAISELSSEVDNANQKLNKILSDVSLLENNLSKLSRDHMTTANVVADIVRDLPILDFMDPYYKVNQIVVNEIKYNVNFASVQTVDRCTSCHLGIDKNGFEEVEHPFKSHPNLDLFLTSASPHPIERFGCTGCHAGRARGTTFVTAVHMPNTGEAKHDWEEEYSWKKMHHWLKPMLPVKYTEAGCYKCHSGEAYIKGADKLSLGLTLIEKAGCYGCHTIEKYTGKRKSGPDLTRINEKTDREWTQKWVKDPKSFRHNTWMPSFFNQTNNNDHHSIKRNDTEIYAMVEYLFKDKQEVDRNQNHSKYLGDADNGQELFNSVGCMGCHTVALEPDDTEMTLESMLDRQGPNLISLGSKTTPKWLYNWIKDPKSYWPDTKMPDLRLSDSEAKDITAYLYSMKNNEFDASPGIELDKEELTSIADSWLKKKYSLDTAEEKLTEMDDNELVDFVAKKSLAYYGCFGCHIIEGFEDAKPIGTDLTFEGSKPVEKLDFGYIHDIDHVNYAWFEKKLENPRLFDLHKEVAPEDKLRMPNFDLRPEEIEAIVTAIMGFTDDVVDHSIRADVGTEAEMINAGMNIIKEYNCQGCHIIDDFGGKIAEAIGKAEFSPPNLNTQGAKTQPDWLFEFLKHPSIIRPNLKVRMPSFGFEDEKWNKIITAFQYMDEQTKALETDHHVNKKSTVYHAGVKLAELGACENCHFIGTTQPKQSSSTWAPNLAMTKDRLRPEWVIDWLRDPSAIMPGTKMPAPFLPTAEYLEMDGAEKDWGKPVVELGGDQEKMLTGIRDWLFALKGKSDISEEIKKYFDKNGYPFLEEQETGETDDDDDWGDEDEDW